MCDLSQYGARIVVYDSGTMEVIPFQEVMFWDLLVLFLYSDVISINLLACPGVIRTISVADSNHDINCF